MIKFITLICNKNYYKNDIIEDAFKFENTNASGKCGCCNAFNGVCKYFSYITYFHQYMISRNIDTVECFDVLFLRYSLIFIII
jgi:hypothetical protein